MMTGLNTEFLNALKEQAQGCNSCADLQEISAKILATLNTQLSAITEQLAFLEPLQDLLELPTSPADVIDWVKKLVENLIEPMLKPMLSYELQFVQLTAFIAEMTQVIQSLTANFPNCEITLTQPMV